MATRSLTQNAITTAFCPPEKSELRLWDGAQPGLMVRVRTSGSKAYAVRYRPGGGRNAPVRTHTLGDVGSMSLADARKLARRRLGEYLSADDTFLTGPEAAQFLRRSVPTLERWARVGDGPVCRKVGGRVLYPLSGLRLFVGKAAA